MSHLAQLHDCFPALTVPLDGKKRKETSKKDNSACRCGVLGKQFVRRAAVGTRADQSCREGDQLDVENESRIAGNDAAGALGAVAELRRDP